MKTRMKALASKCGLVLLVLLSVTALTSIAGCIGPCPWVIEARDGDTTGDGDGNGTQVDGGDTAGDGDGNGAQVDGGDTAGDGDGNGAQVDGAALYSANCASCHGNDGASGFAPDITGNTAAELTTGLASATHGSISLTGEEIAAIAEFLGG